MVTDCITSCEVGALEGSGGGGGGGVTEAGMQERRMEHDNSCEGT